MKVNQYVSRICEELEDLGFQFQQSRTTAQRLEALTNFVNKQNELIFYVWSVVEELQNDTIKIEKQGSRNEK